MRTIATGILIVTMGMAGIACPALSLSQDTQQDRSAAGAIAVSNAEPIEATPLLESLGNPLAARYPDGSSYHYARTISDLQAFDGKLYIGHGDVVVNSGLTDIWYYDLRAGEFVKQGQIEDEAADHYRIIEGALYLPGMDPREDWTLGNFYRLEQGSWVKHRTLPGSVHNNDLVGLEGKLYAVSGREKPPMCLLVSSDDGKTWTAFDVPTGNQRIEGRLIVWQGHVYITTVTTAGRAALYRFNGHAFESCEGDLVPGAEPPVQNDPDFRSWTSVDRATGFKGQVVYIGATRSAHFNQTDITKAWPANTIEGLFLATFSGPNRFAAVKIFGDQDFTDIASDGDQCYAIGYRWKDENDPRQGAITSVFASEDLKQWTKLLKFEHETFATALEVIDGDFYFGLGATRQYCAPSTGMILKIARDQLK